MKISDLEKKLKELREKYGDNELSFNVKDYYGVYGHHATMHGDKPGDRFHEGTFTTNGHTLIYFSLDEEFGKHPKIYFRK